MEKIKNKISEFKVKARNKAIEAYVRGTEAMRNEDGDTNFISIVIILAIVLVVAGIFIGFKDEIVELAESAMNTFKGQFAGQKR